MSSFFADVTRSRQRRPDEGTGDGLAYRVYDPDRMVGGKRMEDHLRIAVCYWHSFNWPGSDVFGAGTFDRPWLDAAVDPMEAAFAKQDAAFEFFAKLGTPFYCFHDADMAPARATRSKESRDNLDGLVDRAEREDGRDRRRGCCGGRPTCSPTRGTPPARRPTPTRRCSPTRRPRSATRSRPRTAWAARTTCCGAAARATRPCSTPTCAREGDQLGPVPATWWPSTSTRSASPARCSSSRSRRSRPSTSTTTTAPRCTASSTATAWSASTRSTSRATTPRWRATRSTTRWPTPSTNGIFGSIDANRGDPQNGWDTDQFPNSVEELSPVLYEILSAGGFTTGGFNFDTKLRRQSMDRDRPVPRSHRRHRHAGAGAARWPRR